MSPLIKISTSGDGGSGSGVQTVNARDLHAFLGNRDRFATWIKDRITKYGFVLGQDYATTEGFSGNSEKPQGGRPSTEYHLSLDMAKELAMVGRTEKGKRAR